MFDHDFDGYGGGGGDGNGRHNLVKLMIAAASGYQEMINTCDEYRVCSRCAAVGMAALAIILNCRLSSNKVPTTVDDPCIDELLKAIAYLNDHVMTMSDLPIIPTKRQNGEEQDDR